MPHSFEIKSPHLSTEWRVLANTYQFRFINGSHTSFIDWLEMVVEEMCFQLYRILLSLLRMLWFYYRSFFYFPFDIERDLVVQGDRKIINWYNEPPTVEVSRSKSQVGSCNIAWPMRWLEVFTTSNFVLFYRMNQKPTRSYQFQGPCSPQTPPCPLSDR